MAKSKETSTPLIASLVFFVLATIAFGVMWYLSYSDMETHVNAKKSAEKDLAGVRAAKDEAERLARVYRVYLGVPRDDDATVVNTEARPNDKIAAELKQLNEAVAKKLGAADASALPAGVELWQVDAAGKAAAAPAAGLIDQFAKLKGQDAAYAAADAERANYRKQIDAITQDAAALKAATAALQKASADFPEQVKKQVNDVVAAFDKRTERYKQSEAASGKELEAAKAERNQFERELRRERDRVAELAKLNQELTDRRAADDAGAGTDEPHGKVVRRQGDGVIELNVGSAAGIRAGQRFTVLPSDFPTKGRQSRVRAIRAPDDLGRYESYETFLPRAVVEVFEVVDQNLSRARVARWAEMDLYREGIARPDSPVGKLLLNQPSEADPIRDGILPGDLLYNSRLRRGVAEHVALVGVFDTNGDGTDDIASVIRELSQQGIAVDAYFDLKKRAWVGEVGSKTNYVVGGQYPAVRPNDPNRDEKLKMLADIGRAFEDARQKGVTTINFHNFFSRLGFKYRFDVPDDKINQAAAAYLGAAGGNSDAPPPAKP